MNIGVAQGLEQWRSTFIYVTPKLLGVTPIMIYLIPWQETKHMFVYWFWK